MNITLIRKLDALGRIVIPRGVRNLLQLAEGDALRIDIVDGKIVLTPVAE